MSASARGVETTVRSGMTRGAVRSLAILAVAGMAGHGLAMTLTGPALPEIMRAFAVRETAVGILLSAGSLGFMAGCLVGGFVTDELGLKPVLLAAWIGVLATLVGFPFSGTYAVLVLVFALLGLASGVLETGLNVLPTQVGGGAGMMNFIHVGYGVGALAAPLIVGGVLDGGGSWRLPYLLVALVPLLLMLRGAFMPMPAASRQAAQHEERQPLVTLLRHPLVLLSAAALLFYVAAEMGVSGWIVLFMAQRFQAPPFQASLALSVFWGLILVGRAAQGPLSKVLSLPALIVGNSVLFGAAIVGLATAGTVQAAFAYLVLAGFGASGLYPNVMIYCNCRYARQVGAVTGVLSMAAAAGAFAFHPVIGWVAERYGLAAAFVGMAACALIVALCYAPVWAGRVRD